MTLRAGVLADDLRSIRKNFCEDYKYLPEDY
jgi:hypothetical protein